MELAYCDTLEFESSGPGLCPDQGNFVVFLGNISFSAGVYVNILTLLDVKWHIRQLGIVM